VAFALSLHVRRLHEEGLPVPPEVEELAALLTCVARGRQDPPNLAGETGAVHHGPVPERLLVTKSEAAEQLGVSVRTIERLVASGRLPQVHVERLARFRVSDLEAFAENLGHEQGHDIDPEGRDERG
jgi:excisionase family DNA binding protein